MNLEPILIVGCGSMACLTAVRLIQAGFTIHLVDDWKEGIESIRRQGIRLLSVNSMLPPVFCPVYLPDENIPPAHYALVLVKSWQTRQAGAVLSRVLSPDGLAVTLQNGLGNDQVLREYLGKDRVISGITTLGATLTSPGNVIGFEQGKIVLEQTPNSLALRSILNSAGFICEMDSDIRNQIWGKLIINAAINPLTAILKVPNGKILESPNTCHIMEQIISEGQQVMQKLNVRLPYPDPIKQIHTVIRATAANQSSMYQDILRDAPTEIDQMNGAIVNLGSDFGIPTPYNLCMTDLIKAIVNQTKI